MGIKEGDRLGVIIINQCKMMGAFVRVIEAVHEKVRFWAYFKGYEIICQGIRNKRLKRKRSKIISRFFFPCTTRKIQLTYHRDVEVWENSLERGENYINFHHMQFEMFIKYPRNC